MKTKNAFLESYSLILILALAAVLRLHNINQPFIDAFSWPQANTAMIADNFFRVEWNPFHPQVSWGGYEPNYQAREFPTVSYIAGTLYFLMGEHEWIGRSVSIVFSLWGIFSLYQLVSHIRDKKTALVSAAILAIMPGGIFIDRSFLSDPAMVALVTTSFWMLLLYLRTGRERYLFFAGITGAWGFITKCIGLLVIIPMLYAIACYTRNSAGKKRYNLAALATFILFTIEAVIFNLLWAYHINPSHTEQPLIGVENLVWEDGIGAWMSQNYFLPTLWQIMYEWLWTAPILLLAFIGFILPGLKQKIERKPGCNYVTPLPWLFHTWLLAFGIFYLLSAKEIIYYPWSLAILNPAVAALVGHGIVQLISFLTSNKQPILSASMAIFFLFFVGVNSHTSTDHLYQAYAQESYELGLELRKITRPDEMIVTLANTIDDPIALYYSQRKGWVFSHSTETKGRAWNHLPEDDNEAIFMLENLRRKGADWLGIVDERKKDFWVDHPELVEHINRTCHFQDKTPKWVLYKVPHTVS
ncbi:glycosyltransferase family 39 protein [Leptolyngbya cf. ectocarpi LEGE 11479]|uniref:Glycosyltransferase family 39 protein n=2 Tax=Leptolyngbya ectocarpi TaxID=1202 RepID=A0A928ZQQ1_LEPEC|nr:glycosyltransferase family 39 protein [Leptolyngbya cf. ectocarpi LEGE 11479]